MPDLSRVAAVLGVPFKTTTGQTFRATVRPPPQVNPSWEGSLVPRQTILLPRGVLLPANGVIIDGDGNRFLHSVWSSEGVLGNRTAVSHVLYAVTAYEVWTRPTYTTEAISGQRVPDEPEMLGLVPVVREFLRRKDDTLNVTEEIYRVLCAAALKVGDHLDARRVTRVESVRGLTFAEVF